MMGFIEFTTSSPYFPWFTAFAGASIALWIDGLLRRTQSTKLVSTSDAETALIKSQAKLTHENRLVRKEQKANAPNFAGSLYVGNILVDASKLADGFVEITIRGFNCSGGEISICDITGFCRFAMVLDGSTPKSEKGALLPPLIRPEPKANKIPDRKEFSVVLQQPIPRVVLQSMIETLEKVVCSFNYLISI